MNDTKKKDTMKTKHIQALTKISNKDSDRYYANGIYLDYGNGRAVATDSISLLYVPIEKDNQKEACLVKHTDIVKELAVAKARKADEVDIGPCRIILRNYPNYEKAFPKNVTTEITLDLKRLKKIIDALAAGSIAKDSRVKISFNRRNEPVQFDCEDMAGLLAPVRDED